MNWFLLMGEKVSFYFKCFFPLVAPVGCLREVGCEVMDWYISEEGPACFLTLLLGFGGSCCWEGSLIRVCTEGDTPMVLKLAREAAVFKPF